ncbi:hypothetical protein CUMW_089270 [Citrus unshiu]|nr:hypothetical protein CUMW_089270 [Citrus unshiu]
MDSRYKEQTGEGLVLEFGVALDSNCGDGDSDFFPFALSSTCPYQQNNCGSPMISAVFSAAAWKFRCV